MGFQMSPFVPDNRFTLKMSSQDSDTSSSMSTDEQRRTGYNNRGRAKVCFSSCKRSPVRSNQMSPRISDKSQASTSSGISTFSAKMRFDTKSELEGTRSTGRKLKAKGHFGRKARKYNRHRKVDRAEILAEIARENAGLPPLPRPNKKSKHKRDPSRDLEVIAISNMLDSLIESARNST